MSMGVIPTLALFLPLPSMLWQTGSFRRARNLCFDFDSTRQKHNISRGLGERTKQKLIPTTGLVSLSLVPLSAQREESDATLAHRTRRAVAPSQRVGEGLGVRVSGQVSAAGRGRKRRLQNLPFAIKPGRDREKIVSTSKTLSRSRRQPDPESSHNCR